MKILTSNIENNKIILKLTINNVIITIIFKKHKDDEYGRYNPRLNKIIIDFDINNYNLIKIKRTIVHELWHCIFDLYCLDIAKSDDFEHKFIMIYQNYKEEVEYIFQLIFDSFNENRNKLLKNE